VPIELYRIDDRLIHGQVVVGWGQPLDLQFIVLVDEEVAASDWEQELYRMGVPPEMDVHFETVTSAAERLAHYQADPHPGLLLTGDIDTMARLVERTGRIPAVNLGGIHHKPGRVQRLRRHRPGDGVAAVRAVRLRVALQDLRRDGFQVHAAVAPAQRSQPGDVRRQQRNARALPEGVGEQRHIACRARRAGQPAAERAAADAVAAVATGGGRCIRRTRAGDAVCQRQAVQLPGDGGVVAGEALQRAQRERQAAVAGPESVAVGGGVEQAAGIGGGANGGERRRRQRLLRPRASRRHLGAAERIDRREQRLRFLVAVAGRCGSRRCRGGVAGMIEWHAGGLLQDGPVLVSL